MKYTQIIIAIILTFLIVPTVSALTAVNNCTDLENMANNLSEDYVLGQDIDCSGHGTFTPVGASGTEFTGSLDGNGYIISDLTISTGNYKGLFGATSSASIEEVGLVDVTVSGGQYVGALVGHMSGGTVNQSYSTGTATGTSGDVGGLVGYSTGLINNSWSSVEVTGGANQYDVAGFVGYNDVGGVIENSYSTGNATTGEYVGGFVGDNSGTVTNSFCTGLATNADVAEGGFVGENYGTLTNVYYNNYSSSPELCGPDQVEVGCTAINDDIPYFYNTSAAPLSSWDYNVWGISKDNEGFPMLQWEEQRYVINTCQELQDMWDDLNGDYTLGQDIDCNGFDYGDGKGFLPIGNQTDEFRGSLNGSGYVISNLYINRNDTDRVGLFGKVHTAEIYDLGLSNINVTGKWYVGGLIGQSFGLTTVNRVYITGGVSAGTYHSAGLVGNSQDLTISNCWTNVDVTGESDVGGVSGYAVDIQITNCYATGDIVGDDDVGGLAGVLQKSGKDTFANNSYATGSVTANTDFGGIIGDLAAGAFIENSYWNNHSGNPSICSDDGDTGCTAIADNEAYFYNTANGPMDEWDFVNVWDDVYVNVTYPPLAWQNPPAPIIACGADLNQTGETYFLAADLTATVDCLTVSADNITLEGQGYNITGDSGAGDGGIVGSSIGGLTVRNIEIYKFGKGIDIEDLDDSIIENSIIGDAVLSIDLETTSNRNIIRNNTMYGGSSEAIYLVSGDDNLIEGNTIYNKGYGIYLDVLSANDNIILNNQIYDCTFGTFNSLGGAQLLIYNNSYGEIKWPVSLIEVTGDIVFPGNITIGNNSAYVDSDNLPGLNITANVTLYGIGDRGYSQPAILKDGEVCTDCYNFTALDAATVIFNVTGFSTYTIGETPVTTEKEGFRDDTIGALGKGALMIGILVVLALFSLGLILIVSGTSGASEAVEGMDLKFIVYTIAVALILLAIAMFVVNTILS